MLSSSIVVQSSSFKNVGPSGLPCGQIALRKLPNLFACMVWYVRQQKLKKVKYLFDTQGMSPSAFVSKCLEAVAAYFKV